MSFQLIYFFCLFALGTDNYQTILLLHVSLSYYADIIRWYWMAPTQHNLLQGKQMGYSCETRSEKTLIPP